MDLALTDEQVAMAEVVGDLVASWLESPPGDDARWRAVADVGLDAALAPRSRADWGSG